MVKRTLLIAPSIAMSALFLAACGSGAERDAAVNAAPADDYAERIRALPEGQRDAVLLRAIRDAGQTCQHVTRSVAVADAGGTPSWQARCDDGTTWVVTPNSGGIATVTGATPTQAQR